MHVYGSYTRGALEPADVDVSITHHVDKDFSKEVVGAIMDGRDPMASTRAQGQQTRHTVPVQPGRRPLKERHRADPAVAAR
uniref:Polymerase nucleotidyl transferase domain-containing protein n=1 Tax=Streptomyces auratus AGR0001 TaxID=1160718 RepID=J1RVM4_9ACTN